MEPKIAPVERARRVDVDMQHLLVALPAGARTLTKRMRSDADGARSSSSMQDAPGLKQIYAVTSRRANTSPAAPTATAT